MTKFRSIKGTHDILPDDLYTWSHIEKVIHKVMRQYGYGEIRTPAFENTELFVRGIGTETDIVNKEMYSWQDQGGNNLTLKPEMTAPVVRSYLQHQLGNTNPLNRLYYIDALFRRERPQKGRQRQFHQFGVEAIGSPHPEQDAEIISMAFNIFSNNFGIENLEVRLNSIGSKGIRQQFIKLLKSELNKVVNILCSTCQNRLNKNALRIFDCKKVECQKILDENAPLIFDSISDSDLKHFNVVTKILNEMKIPFSHDKKLVRGLDYYSHTTFEITSSLLGAQDAICGGGRYNGLVEQLGGKPTPAVGFAAGIERLILTLDKQLVAEECPKIYFITIGEEASIKASMIANNLREKHDKVVVIETLRRSLKAQMREAGRTNATITLIFGDDELNANTIIVKDMTSSLQKTVPISDLATHIRDLNLL